MTDVIIIGSGIVGCALARELKRYQIDVLVLERASDVCEGATKANSAIVHSGLDAKTGTKKAHYNVLGNVMYSKVKEELGIKLIRNGSLNICLEEEGRPEIEALYQQGINNGVTDLRILERDELLAMEPNLQDSVVCALYAPTAGIIDSFEVNIAFAENAVSNGARFEFDTEVLEVKRLEEGGYLLKTNRGDYMSRAVINAAGIHSDEFNNMVSEHKLKIHARRGEYFLIDKYEKNFVKYTIFQQPTKEGKGVLVAPTVSDNIIVGPNAHEVEKDDVSTTRDGLLEVATKSIKAVKNVPLYNTITSFSGLRATGESGDFEIGEVSDSPFFFNCAAIESPGLTSAPAIAVDLAKEVAEKLGAEANPNFNPIRKRPIILMELTDEEKHELIKRDPSYGRMVCRCENISEGEVIAAMRRPLGAKSLDGIKRRTRAGSGRCQAGFCTPRQMDLLMREHGLSFFELTKRGGKSYLVTNKNKAAFVKEEN